MRWTILPPVVILAALLPAAPISAVPSDFRLPPDPSSQQPPPDRQGPVAPDVPESRLPRPAAPGEAQPAPAPTPAAPRIVLPDFPEAARTPAPSRATPTADPRPPRSSTEASAETRDAPSPEPVPAEVPQSADEAPNPPPPGEAAPPNVANAGTEGGGGLWIWLLAALAAVGAAGIATVAWRRRKRPWTSDAPQIERPRLTPAPDTPDPIDSAVAEPLQVTLEPLRLSLTLMNATLAYRLEVVNRGPAPITALRIGADMIAAHASMTREQQLSGPGDGAATVQRIDRLDPGESRIVEGEFRVPFTQIVPIRQGSAALLLPLARFRLEAEAAAPVVRTFAVGQSGPQAGLQPFRLDLGPRVYPKLTQRAFA